MKAKSWLYALMLIVWMGGSTYWYVCKIKHDCPEPEIEEATPHYKIAQKSKQEIIADLEKNTPKEDPITARLKEKLTTGYIVSDFPQNATENNQIKDNFNEFVNDLQLYIAENKNAKIELTGHTDNKGRAQANLILGKERAEFIKRKLMDADIPEQNIILRTNGETEPVQSNSTAAGRAKNRRVEIKLSK